jgi:hypothetical protein
MTHMVEQKVQFILRIEPGASPEREDYKLRRVESTTKQFIIDVRTEHGEDALVLNGDPKKEIITISNNRYAMYEQPVLVDTDRVKVETYA